MSKNNNLSVIAYVNGWTCWHYVDFNLELKDFSTDVGFFNFSKNLMNVGDKIVIVLKDSYVEQVITKIENGKVFTKNIICTVFEEDTGAEND